MSEALIIAFITLFGNITVACIGFAGVVIAAFLMSPYSKEILEYIKAWLLVQIN